MTATDTDLATAALGGDRPAFAALAERHRPALERACRRALRDPHAAADAAQEAMVAALLGLHQLRDPARFGSWLVGIGLNVSRRMLAAQERPSALAEAERPDPAAGPAELVELDWIAARVRAAVAKLPPGQRDAVLAFYLAGLTHAEAAAELGVAATAVKTRLHKARRSLRTSLSDLEEETSPMSRELPRLIPMRVAELRRTARTDDEPRHVVFLDEEGGKRRLLIWIGPAEATALAVLLERVELPRPTTVDLAAGLLAATGGRLAEVRIVRLTGNTFYAETVLADGTAVDARPSDALALATLVGAPIRVDETVLEAAASAEESFDDLRAEAMAAKEDAATLATETRERLARAKAEWAVREA